MTTPAVAEERSLALRAVADLTNDDLWDRVLNDLTHVVYALAELTAVLVDVDAQLAQANDDESSGRPGDGDWRRRARNYRRLVTKRVAQAKAVEKAENIRLSRDRAEFSARQVGKLLRAIEAHADATTAAGLDAETHDTTLWTLAREVRQAGNVS